MNSTLRKHIADLLSQRESAALASALESHHSALDSLTQRNAEYQSFITSNLRRMAETRAIIDLAYQQSEQDNFGAHLVEEWQLLSEHPRLADASMRGETLRLVTVDDVRLHAPDREDTRWLGAFEIVIHLSNGSIRLNNLNTRRGGRDHPHVVDGNPCFGSNHHAFTQLQANGDLYALFELLLQYLETINLEDEYGRFGAYWFEQEDVRPEERSIEREVIA